MSDAQRSLYDSTAGIYPSCRPDYPDALFNYLGSLTSRKVLAWDCGTGPGLVARKLALLFDQVVGTDLSADTIAVANENKPTNVKFNRGPAEASDLNSATVDLITAAQAFHQFDYRLFYQEARRVLRPGGVLAVWAYLLPSVNEAVNLAVHDLYRDQVLYRHWPAWIAHLENEYSHLPLLLERQWRPFELEMRQGYDLASFLSYLGTWAAVLFAHRAGDQLALAAFSSGCQRITDAWGEPHEKRQVVWRVFGQTVQVPD